LKIQPENPYALINMGIIAEHEKQFKKAEEIYQQVLDLADSRQDSAEANQTPEDQALLNTARENLRKIQRNASHASKK
jgi:Tfp pilus assembly protein PilF